MDAGDDGDPAIEVRGDTVDPLMTITVSADGADWMINDHRRGETVALPRDATLSQFAKTIVREPERPE